MILYRIDAGSADGIEVRNIVGAVTNETGLRNRFIGQIRIHPDHATIELPDDLPPKMIEHLRKVYVGGKAMKMTAVSGEPQGRPAHEEAPARPKPKSKPNPKAKPKQKPKRKPRP